MQTLVVNPNETRLRLDVFVTRRLAELSRSRVQTLIENSQIRLNGKVVRSRELVQAGDQVTVEIPAAVPVELEPEDLPLDILFEDEAILIINKLAGVTVHPGAGAATGTLVHGLLFHCRDLSGIGGELRPGIVHRLDRETSGCLVVAKNDAAHQRLSRAFAGREVAKYYLAFCRGIFRNRTGELTGAIGRHPVQRQKMTVLASGRPARTRYEVIQVVGDNSWVLCRLYSGRTHQIRVHLQYLGHPIIGDRVYGRAVPGLNRQLLHAWRIGFNHPFIEKWIEFEAGIPQEFRDFGINIDDLARVRDRLTHATPQNAKSA
jgi:23S rRNA pseudouridine1911/1915/1917 synthase